MFLVVRSRRLLSLMHWQHVLSLLPAGQPWETTVLDVPQADQRAPLWLGQAEGSEDSPSRLRRTEEQEESVVYSHSHQVPLLLYAKASCVFQAP
eukprot:6193719-Pyramimonas_sp.AAC.1